MPLDITSAEQAIQSKIDAYKTYREIAVAQKKLLKEQGNSISAANSQITSQLNKIQELQPGIFTGGTFGNNLPKLFNLDLSNNQIR